MSIVATILASLGGKFVDVLLGNVRGIFEAYFKKEISEAELKAKVQEALLTSWRDVEIANADSISKTYESFQVTMRQSKTVQFMWAVVVGTQLAVLLWHQVGIPYMTYVMRVSDPAWSYPSSGSTVEWAYALLGSMFGVAVMLYRQQGGGASVVDKLKAVLK